MKTTQLKTLQKSFEPYQQLGVEWLSTNPDVLTAIETKFLLRKIKMNFAANLQEFIFQNKRNQQYPILISKLDEGYTDYQDWVIEIFQNLILNLLRRDFELLPHQQISELPLGANQINILQRFGYHSIKEIFSNIHEKDFRTPQYFSIVLEYTVNSPFFGPNNKSLRKEVATRH